MFRNITQSNKRLFGLMFVRCVSETAGEHHRVVIIGGGTAGLAVANKLGRGNHTGVVIDPSPNHYYQPGWTLAGAGLIDKNTTVKPLKGLIDKNFSLEQDSVDQIVPEQNYVVTKSKKKIGYDFLVVAAGIKINWDAIKGLPEALGKNGVCSNYSFESCDKTLEFINKFDTGRALFTQPSTPIKCSGAPQKAMYLSEEILQTRYKRRDAEVVFYTGNKVIFPVKKYADGLLEVIKDRAIDVNYQHELIEIKAETNEAIFSTPTGIVSQKYDFLHVVPPMGPPDFIKNSPLADPVSGFVNVNKETTQHVLYKNVFAAGDCSNAPKSRTASAISAEAPVLCLNLEALLKKQTTILPYKYDGYTGCPLLTGKGTAILAEFDYDLKPKESFSWLFYQDEESRIASLLKRFLFPQLYWGLLIKGLFNYQKPIAATPSKED